MVRARSEESKKFIDQLGIMKTTCSTHLLGPTNTHGLLHLTLNVLVYFYRLQSAYALSRS